MASSTFDRISLQRRAIEKTNDFPSKWSITINTGIYKTAVHKVYYIMPVYGDLNTGIPIVRNDALKPQFLSFYSHSVHSIGTDFSYNLSPKWQLRSDLNLFMYRYHRAHVNKTERGSNYFQLAFGGDYSLLQFKRFKWQIGTGIGTGLLRNQTQAGVENHLRSEWNINTALSYSINSKIAIRLQPTSRLIVSDTQVGGFGKLSKWYHGGNIGVTLNL